jgi:hypothetical protein
MNFLFWNCFLAGKEGPIHDVQWSPTGKDFLVIYGCILSFQQMRAHFCLAAGTLTISIAYSCAKKLLE